MATYYVITSDLDGNINWNYPSEIEAIDKNDAYKAIAESCPPDSIKAIFTAAEYQAKMSNKLFQKQVRADSLEDGNAFMNNMINIATESAEENNSSQPILPVQEEQSYIQPKHKQTPKSEPKYFTDNGIMFKIENNVLYKKCWEDVELNDTTDENGNVIPANFRIINAETGKLFKSDKYKIQQLVWKSLNNIS